MNTFHYKQPEAALGSETDDDISCEHEEYVLESLLSTTANAIKEIEGIWAGVDAFYHACRESTKSALPSPPAVRAIDNVRRTAQTATDQLLEDLSGKFKAARVLSAKRPMHCFCVNIAELEKLIVNIYDLAAYNEFLPNMLWSHVKNIPNKAVTPKVWQHFFM